MKSRYFDPSVFECRKAALDPEDYGIPPSASHPASIDAFYYCRQLDAIGAVDVSIPSFLSFFSSLLFIFTRASCHSFWYLLRYVLSFHWNSLLSLRPGSPSRHIPFLAVILLDGKNYVFGERKRLHVRESTRSTKRATETLPALPNPNYRSSLFTRRPCIRKTRHEKEEAFENFRRECLTTEDNRVQ